MIALDGQTGLPLGYINVIKNDNYFGSSKGNKYSLHSCSMQLFVCSGMEGWGALQIMKELHSCGLKVVNLLHDKDASTFNHVLEVFQDVSESLCASKKNTPTFPQTLTSFLTQLLNQCNVCRTWL